MATLTRMFGTFAASSEPQVALKRKAISKRTRQLPRRAPQLLYVKKRSSGRKRAVNRMQTQHNYSRGASFMTRGEHVSLKGVPDTRYCMT